MSLGAGGIAKYDDQSIGSELDAEVDDPERAAAAAAAATRFKSGYESIGCRIPGPIVSGNPIPPPAGVAGVVLLFDELLDIGNVQVSWGDSASGLTPRVWV